MQVDCLYIPLVRINAPKIYADPEFNAWFFNRPKACDYRVWVADCEGIATDGGKLLPLSGDEIDRLCVRLNYCGSVLAAAIGG